MNSRFFQLLGPTSDARGIWSACVLVACFMHFAVAGMLSDPPPLTASIPVTEVELEPTKPPEAPPPQPAPEPPPPAAAAPPPAKMRARKAPDPPAPARAGKLLTALEEPESQPRDDEPVRFVTDPNGRDYGTGIVARGGTAEHGESSAPRPTSPAAPSGLRITPADLLKRQPLLLGDGCRGYFPEHARLDQGVVSIVATVHPSGAIAKLEIESETPEGEGFASAAKACLAKRKFVPALDEHGEPTGARTRINVRFTR